MGTPGLWIGFTAAVLALLALDLGVFNRRPHAVSLREAAFWSLLWVALSLAFGSWILLTHGKAAGIEFFAGYLIEKSLSLDNIFVFLLVFRAMGVQPRFQHRVLFWGVVGALLLRGIMIAAGVALIHRFAWILFVFGALLLYAGLHLLIRGHKNFRPEDNSLLRWARRTFPMATTDTGQHFWVVENGRRAVTSLFLALVVIEGADVLFALDSIPAVFGVTHDPFIVYASNVCAILGLRSFYFLLAGVLPLFRYLDAGISSVLIFIGAKMLAEPWLHVPTYLSLIIVSTLLGTAVVASLFAARNVRPAGNV
jgi:tellurite resistance protein TerC